MATLITIVTISQVIATWTNVLMVIGCVFLSALVAERLRRVIVQAGLDAIQLYSGFSMARLDVQARQLLVATEVDRARLAIRSQRLQLERDIDNGSS